MVKIIASVIFAVLLGASCAQAQVDGLTPPLPTAGERRAADIASWGTVVAAVALDAHATWKTHCEDSWDECEGAMVRSALRVGLTLGVTQLVKMAVHRQRPCANECGFDSPNSSFYSMHTALAFSTLGGPRLAFALPLSVGTGGLRIAAGKHYLTDVLVGVGVGALTSRIR